MTIRLNFTKLTDSSTILESNQQGRKILDVEKEKRDRTDRWSLRFYVFFELSLIPFISCNFCLEYEDFFFNDH